MVDWRKFPEWKLRLAVAILGGLCLACAFPSPGIAGFAWIGPGIIAGSALGAKGGWQRFRLGYIGGLTHYLVSLYWLLNIPYRWLGIPFGPAAGWLALSMFLALFIGGWVWLVTGGAGDGHFPRRQGPLADTVSLEDHLAQARTARFFWAFLGAVAWVCMEMIVARIFGGFPWNLLGASQYRMVPLIQVATVTGVYGVSFLAVWFALSLLALKIVAVRQPEKRSAWVLELVVPGLVVAVLFNIGFRQIRQAPSEETEPPISIALIQPSIPQTLIWDEGNDDLRFKQMLELSENALTNHPQLLIWPEAAIPKLLRYDEEVFRAVTNLAYQHKVWLIVGADDAEPRLNTPDPKDADYYNSSFLVSPEGQLVNRYRKRSLVIFGEYIPLIKWMPFLAWFTPIQGGFTEGTEAVQFALTTLGLQTSVLICYEDVFPWLGRSATTPETDFLVNITNDGWFGESAEPWQHAILAVFRAVENRIPLIRCTNTGLTCWIDEYGRIREIFRDARGSVYGPGIAMFKLPNPSRDQPATFYNRHGDVFGWSCVIITIAMTVFQVVQSRRHRA